MSGALDAHSASVLANQRRESLEHLRKNHVPRFLFRAFGPQSGGGFPHTMNDAHIITPHAYMVGKSVPPFYSLSDHEILNYATAHYHGRHSPLSPFSSWAASLHLVLCHAHFLGPESHVAIMDTERLNTGALVWHVPQILKHGGNHEFLAYGIINGPGYKAVKLRALEDVGLLDVFPELGDVRVSSGTAGEGYEFGFDIRSAMFEKRSGNPMNVTLQSLRKIAATFGEFSFPVVTALLCIRPWPWFKRNGSEGRSSPTGKDLIRILEHLGIANKPSWLDTGLPWLRYGAVETAPTGYRKKYYFPDVRQWIDLLDAIANHTFEVTNKRKRVEESSDNEEEACLPLKQRLRSFDGRTAW